jgi:hypothetical protein
LKKIRNKVKSMMKLRSRWRRQGRSKSQWCTPGAWWIIIASMGKQCSNGTHLLKICWARTWRTCESFHISAAAFSISSSLHPRLPDGQTPDGLSPYT